MRLDARLVAVGGRRDRHAEALPRPRGRQMLAHGSSSWSSGAAPLPDMIFPPAMDPLPLTTDRLSIRLLREDDARRALPHLRRPRGHALRRQHGPGPHPRRRPRENLTQFIADRERHGFGLWAATLRESGEMIGMCGLLPVEGTGPDVEVVYVLERSRLGQGVRNRDGPRLSRGRVRAVRARPHHRSRLPRERPVDPRHGEGGMQSAGTLNAHGHDLVCYEAFAGASSGGRPSR